MSNAFHDNIITILGCGDSAGVPRIGGEWGACDPLEQKNLRSRPSLLVQSSTSVIAVDTGPDFRTQLTKEKILDLNGVLFTHGHSDHVNGIDELRSYHRRNKKYMPVYTDEITSQELLHRFSYVFKQKSEFYPAVAEIHVLKDSDMGIEHHINDISFVPFVQDHGEGVKSLGYRFDMVGYSTDMVDLDERAIDALKGIKTWIVDCADYHKPSGYFHASFSNLKKLNEKIGAEKLFLIHMGIHMDYKKVLSECPDGYRPAYDGLKIKSDGSVL